MKKKVPDQTGDGEPALVSKHESEGPATIQEELSTEQTKGPRGSREEPVPQGLKLIEMIQMASSTRTGHPLLEKLNPQHIDKLLDIYEKDNDNTYRSAASNKWFNLSYVIIFVSVLCFLIVFLVPSNIGLLSDIIKFLLGLVGGFGAGYGFKSRMDARK